MEASVSLYTETATSLTQARNQSRRSVGRHAAEDDNTQWTAARCLRLLRPLESRIEPLERWAALSNARTHERSLKRKRVDAASNPGSRLFQGNSPPDPVWVPVKQSKRQGVTYASKTDHHDQTTAQPAILLPTPFRVRHQSVHKISDKATSTEHTEEPSQNMASQSTTTSNRISARSSGASRPVKTSGVTTMNGYTRGAQLQTGIEIGLENLLRRTRPPTRGERGCLTLVSTCLRKVPEYIKLEQTTEFAINDDDDTNITAEIYADLEDLGPTSAGWRPLREVVRAHGLAIIEDLLRNGTISPDLGAQILRGVKLNVHEAMPLVTAYITGLCPGNRLTMHKDTHFIRLTPLSVNALDYNEVSPTTSWLRLLKDLFTNGSLSQAWFGARDIAHAARTWVRGLVRPELLADILGFYESASRVICSNAPSTRTQFTEHSYDSIQELFSVLTAMVITGLDHMNDDRQVNTGLAIWTTLQTLSVELLADNPCSLCLDDRAKHTRAVLLMTNLVLDAVVHPSGDDFVKPETKELLRHLAHYCDSQLAICATAQFLTRLASCCGNQQSQASLEFLQSFLGELIKHMQSETAPARMFLQQIIIRASGDFAASDRSRQAVKYAWSVEAAVEEADPLALDELCSAIKPRGTSHVISQDATTEAPDPHEPSFQGQTADRALGKDVAEHLGFPLSPACDSELSLHPAGSSPSLLSQAKSDVDIMPAESSAIPQNAELDVSEGDDSGYVSGHVSTMKTPLRPKASVLPISYLESPDVLASTVYEHSGRHSIHHESLATVKPRMRRARSKASKMAEADHSDDDLA